MTQNTPREGACAPSHIITLRGCANMAKHGRVKKKIAYRSRLTTPTVTISAPATLRAVKIEKKT